MTSLLCPDGCVDKKTEKRKELMNVQTLRMHLLHKGGDGTHPERTASQIERIIFNPDLIPEKAAPAKGIKIKKGSGEK